VQRRRGLLIGGGVLIALGGVGAGLLAATGGSGAPACPPGAAHAAGIDVLAETDQAPTALWASTGFADQLASGTVTPLPSGGTWELLGAAGSPGAVTLTLRHAQQVGTLQVAVSCSGGHWLLDHQGTFRAQSPATPGSGPSGG
jgi:hypothetical protein